MKNIIVASVSALIFLVIGLSIGKKDIISGYKIKIQDNKNVNIDLTPNEFPHKIKNLYLNIFIDDAVTNIVEYKVIHDKIELESMKLGFHFCKTNEQFDAVLNYRIHVDKSDGLNIFIYTSKLSLDKTVEFEISKNRYSKISTIWKIEHSGYFYEKHVDDCISKLLQSSLDGLSISFLKSKEKYN